MAPTIRHMPQASIDDRAAAAASEAGRASTCLEQHAGVHNTTEQTRYDRRHHWDNLRKYIKALQQVHLRIARPKQKSAAKGIRFGG